MSLVYHFKPEMVTGVPMGSGPMGNPWGDTPNGKGAIYRPITFTRRVELLCYHFPAVV